MTFIISVAGKEFCFPCEPDESVLNAAQRAGLEMPFSCRKGVCGTCKGGIVSGEVRAFMGDALSAAEHTAGQALFCNARPRSDLVIAPRSISKADPFARRIVTARVFRLQRLAEDVMLVHLRFPPGIRVKFKAGQHLNLILDNGERRDFSLANPPRESDGAQLHIRHVPGGVFTGYVFSGLKRGDLLRAEIPFGDFTLQPERQACRVRRGVDRIRAHSIDHRGHAGQGNQATLDAVLGRAARWRPLFGSAVAMAAAIAGRPIRAGAVGVAR